MKHLILFFLLLSVAHAGPVLLNKDGLHFEVDSSLYDEKSDLYKTAKNDIADTINMLHAEYLPEVAKEKIKDKKVVVLFENSGSTDAKFYPPGTKRASNADEWIITLNPALITTKKYLRIFAHEYFHA